MSGGSKRALRVLPQGDDARRPTELPTWPHAWYTVARSRDLTGGRVLPVELAGQSLVVYRGEGGGLHAIDAHCPHMGAHLKHGEVVGEALRCPLHHWTIGAEQPGRCRAGAWTVQERLGLVFVYFGDASERPPLPLPESPEALAWISAAPIELPTEWLAMVVNGFDLTHLSAVHHRTLVEPPTIETEPGRIRLRYVSRVSGGGFADRVMRWLSGDRIEVTQTCRGPNVVVQSRIQSRTTSAVLGLLPTPDGVRAFGAFGITRNRLQVPIVSALWTALRLRVTRWLFTAFLRKDFGVVEGMRLRVDVDDVGVRAMAAFLRGLRTGPLLTSGARTSDSESGEVATSPDAPQVEATDHIDHADHAVERPQVAHG